jgi:protoporphyrinogen oxidase
MRLSRHRNLFLCSFLTGQSLETSLSYVGDPRADSFFWFALNGAHKVRDMVPSGKGILTLWTQYPHSLTLDAMSDGEVLAKALKELPMLVPGVSADWVEQALVHRHEVSHPPYAPGAYRAIIGFKDAAKQLRGVSFIGDVLGGAYIESSLRTVADAVARALAA